jgi:tetratricopeptide (TPR) repeat protein
MISCKHCQTQNGLDAKFCKNCGQALPDDQLQEAVQKHEQMVSEGYTLFNAGRTEDAMTIALAAVSENPNSSNAQSLLGMCYERTGQLTEALECFERVLAQNPDSALDRIKVTQLRHALTNHLRTDNRKQNRWALAASATIVLVIIAFGIFVSSHSTQRAVADNIQPSAINPIETKPFPGVVQSVPPATQPVPNSNVVTTPTPSPTPEPELPRAAAKTKEPTDTDNSDAIPPVTPSAPGLNLNNALSVTPEKTNNTVDPQPTTETAHTPQPDPVPATPKDDPGVIEIQVSHSSHTTERAGEPTGNQLQALMKTAREQFLLGRYDSSSRSYEQALRAGGDSAIINQRLGMCYEKTGKSSDAVAAYGRAASAFESALNSGQGDSKRLKSGLDSCRQAIKLLKG